MTDSIKPVSFESFTPHNESIHSCKTMRAMVLKNQHTRQPRSPKARAMRIRHLEHLSVSTVHMAIRHSQQMASLKAMATAIVRDESPSDERNALLRGFEQLTQRYASDARMEKELILIAQKRYTPEWAELEQRYFEQPHEIGAGRA